MEGTPTLFFFFLIILLIFGCAGSSLLSVGFSLFVVHGLVIAEASLIVEHVL